MTDRLDHEGESFVFDPATPLKAGGKFSSVYKGVRASDGLAVVIKKMNPALAGDPSLTERFQNEWTNRINHDHIACVLALVSRGKDRFIVRQFIPGEDLKTFARRKNVTPEVLTRVACQVLDALASLHEHRILHNDIRPANIIVNPDTLHAVLIDLGLSRNMLNPPARAPFALIYASPEQVLQRHAVVNRTSDMYALSVTMYEALAGKPPFHHSHPEMLMNIQLTQSLSPHRNISGKLLEILQRAASKHFFRKPPAFYSDEEVDSFLLEAQAARFESASAMKAALESTLIK